MDAPSLEHPAITVNSLDLFFFLEPRQSIINDINSKLIGFYKGVRDDYSNLRKELDEIEKL